MDACSEVINHPKDSFVREQLFASLTEVVDPAFFETDQPRRGSFNELLQQANVWGTIHADRSRLHALIHLRDRKTRTVYLI
jgi:hypothetical protein